MKKFLVVLFVIMVMLLVACGSAPTVDDVVATDILEEADDEIEPLSTIEITEEPKPEETTFPEKETIPITPTNTPDVHENTTLTVENCEELITILSTEGETSPLYAEFSEKYNGQTIEFDGHIDYITNHGDYDTRWDILLSGGDWLGEEDVSPGPVFKFEDVGLSNLGIKDLFLPEFVSVGGNIHTVAEVRTYDEGAGIFFLKPISIEER